MADPDHETSPQHSAEQKGTPPDPAIDNAKAQMIATLHARIEALTTEVAAKTATLAALKATLTAPPATTVQTHIALLHEYNAIRDIGQGLLGLVAEKRNCRVVDLYRGEPGGEFGAEVGEFGVGVGD